MRIMSPEKGAINLLMNCAHAASGDKLLIAYEPAEFGYYDGDSVGIVARVAQTLGLTVDIVDVGFTPHSPHLPPSLLAQIEAADIILFLARLGDQLRFSEMPQGKTIVVSYASTRDMLGSGFCNAHHTTFLALKAEVDGALDRSERVRITCPLGTEIIGQPTMNLDQDGDTTVRRFPMSVFTPVPAHTFSGCAVMRFLTGTGSKYYDDYSPEFSSPISALMHEGRLTGFEGKPEDVARAHAHYDRVARMFGIDRTFVHSWHAGIHPGCRYPWDMRSNWERWGGTAFGNPRILHFHTCGAYAPGEISWNVIDPTVEVDGVMLWENGVFHAERLPGGADILAGDLVAATLFGAPYREIGLPRELAESQATSSCQDR